MSFVIVSRNDRGFYMFLGQNNVFTENFEDVQTWDTRSEAISSSVGILYANAIVYTYDMALGFVNENLERRRLFPGL